MKRYSFKMKLYPGYREEYKKRHRALWPELEALLTETGIVEYSIWLDTETDILFATQKLSDSFDPAKLSDHPLMKKWWAFMKDIMETNGDMSPVCVELEEMFVMDKSRIDT